MAGDSSLQCILRFSVIILVIYFNKISVKNGMGVNAQLVDPLQNITDQGSWNHLWNITNQEPSDSSPLQNITEQESFDRLWNTTDQELSDPLWNITDHVSVVPLWDVTDQESVDPLWNNGPCLAYTNVTNGVIWFQGSLIQTCSLQVTASPGTRIQLQIPGTHVSHEPLFIYIERYGDFEHCMNKYVLFNEQIKQCNSILRHQSILITMQGYVTLYVSGVSINVSKCVEEQDDVQGNKNVSQISNCSNVEGYNDTITCDPQVIGECRITFPPNCGSVLGHREIVYKTCINDLTQIYSAMIIYPVQIQVLDLSDNNIVQIKVNAFQNFNNVEYLFLFQNELNELDADLFLHLSSLMELQLDNNMLQRLPPNIFHNLRRLEILYLNNNDLSSLPHGVFHDLLSLMHLTLHENRLTKLHQYNRLFDGLKCLQNLEIDNNVIVKWPARMLTELINLKVLLGNSNQLEMIEANAFQGLLNLTFLQLSNNSLTHLDHDLFVDMVSLAYLDLSLNQLKTISNIQHLTKLTLFFLRNNSLTWISHDSFSSDSNTLRLFVSQQEACVCYASHLNCSAADDRSPYLTCDRLLSEEALEVVMWLLGLNALGGNLFVLFWRQKGAQTNKINSMLLQNLAASDLMMGIYMLIIASADSYYGDNFPMQSETWRSGITCRIAGAFSIISSEASVFFVTLISIDRFISIRFPFSMRKPGKIITRLTITLTWMIAIVFGTVPSILSGLNFEFYDNSHVCIGLPLALTKTYDNEVDLIPFEIFGTYGDESLTAYFDVITPQEKGLENGNFFSTAVFLGLNCVCYLVILGCYIEIVRDVHKSSKQAGRSQEMKEQIRLTSKVTAIVATDFCCWFPIIVLGILVQTRVIELPPSVFAWCVTFVLPVNSAINPYLYTIVEIVSQYRHDRKNQSRRTNRKDFQLK